MCLFQSLFPWGICLVIGLLAHMVVLFLVFKGIPTSSSIAAVSIYIPTINARGFPFPNILSSTYCLQTFLWWPFCVSVSSLFSWWGWIKVYPSTLIFQKRSWCPRRLITYKLCIQRARLAAKSLPPLVHSVFILTVSTVNGQGLWKFGWMKGMQCVVWYF